MRAFNGNLADKKHYLDIALKHEAADSYVQGLYWDEQSEKGCNIGCWSKDVAGGHAGLAKQMGIPEELLHVSDGIFEALPAPHFRAWPRRFCQAIPPGADLGAVWLRFLNWMLVHPKWGVAHLMGSTPTARVVRSMAYLFDKAVKGEEVGDAEFDSVTQSAWQAFKRVDSWNDWAAKLTPEARAARCCWTIWECWCEEPARAAWAARAAYSGRGEYALAQAAALLWLLRRADKAVPALDFNPFAMA